MTPYYSDSIKRKAINNVTKDKTPVKKVAAKYNIPLSTLYNWISNYKKKKSPPEVSKADKKIIKKVNQLTTENDILKKALHIENKTESKFQFIHANKDEFPIQTMCKVLDVSSSGYYKFVNSYTSEQELHHQHITELIREVYVKHEGKIGSPKITEIINESEVITSQATVARILESNKDRWRKTYTQFHHNRDVQLYFHNKDTVYDIQNNKHYHKTLAHEDIEALFDSVQFSHFTRYQVANKTSVNGFNDQDNLVIQGDNLIALHKLKSTFKQKVKLIYIDVPYNTERTNLSYADNQSRHQYLLMLQNRLEIAREFLRKDGSIFLHCDDREQAYIKVLCDELFGEENFIHQIVWRKSEGQQNRGLIATTKEYILVYAKNRTNFTLNRRPLTDEQLKKYKYLNKYGEYRIDKIKDAKRGDYKYDILLPTGQFDNGPWLLKPETFDELFSKGLIHWAVSGLPYKIAYKKDALGRIINDLWVEPSIYGSTREATVELYSIVGPNNFTYPKPEKLLKKIIDVATNEGEIVMDFYAGSGTTLAVAHKLNRQYIGVELIKDNFDIIVQRLQTLQKNNSDIHNPFITCQIKT